MENIRKNLLPDTIFGLDCSWSARRNAANAIVVFSDIRSKMIFDFVIISRNKEISDFVFNDSSNMMECAAVKFKKDQFINDYKYIGFIHDFDLDTAAAFQTNTETGQLIEF